MVFVNEKHKVEIIQKIVDSTLCSPYTELVVSASVRLLYTAEVTFISSATRTMSRHTTIQER